MNKLIDIAWAAGFLEGEGCFSHKGKGGVSLSAVQKQREPLDRLQAIFGGKVKIKKQYPVGEIFYWWVKTWRICRICQLASVKARYQRLKAQGQQ